MNVLFFFTKESAFLKKCRSYAGIAQHKHLLDGSSQIQVFKQGIDLYEMNVMLLQKIEELTLYILNLESRIQELENK